MVRFLEAAESGEIGKNGIFTIEEAATKLGMYQYMEFKCHLYCDDQILTDGGCMTLLMYWRA